MSLTVKVITPDKVVWDRPVEEVILPSRTGQLGILPGHVAILTALDTGVLRVRADKDWVSIAVTGGFAEVAKDEVKILVNTAQIGSTIDKETARSEFVAAQSSFEQANNSGDRQRQIQAEAAYKKARAIYQATGALVQ
ncbi:MAG: ATP synthase F1 subunit epsilon [Cyanobacteriota bacterium ELA615]|jgi:F-type H+-transporting ATPase subunit epsilon